VPDQSHLFEEFTRSSRWFLLPSEASEVLKALKHISHLGPARQFIVPKNKRSGGGLLGGDSDSGFSFPSSTSPSNPRTTVTHLGGRSDGGYYDKPANGKRNGYAAHASNGGGVKAQDGRGGAGHKTVIKVQGYPGDTSPKHKWKM
jgi:hypothetical protein